MPEQESIHQLQTEIQTLKIKDEFRTKELDALMKKMLTVNDEFKIVMDQIWYPGYTYSLELRVKPAQNFDPVIIPINI